MNIDITLPNTR